MKAPEQPLRNGLCHKVDEDGRLIEQYYLNDGMAEGPFIKYHLNGRVQCQGEYLHGHGEGEMRMWDESGKLLRIIHASNGQLHGEWREWNADGTLEITWFDRGQKMSNRIITPQTDVYNPQ